MTRRMHTLKGMNKQMLEESNYEMLNGGSVAQQNIYKSNQGRRGGSD